eukprot:gene14172-biopygen6593
MPSNELANPCGQLHWSAQHSRSNCSSCWHWFNGVQLRLFFGYMPRKELVAVVPLPVVPHVVQGKTGSVLAKSGGARKETGGKLVVDLRWTSHRATWNWDGNSLNTGTDGTRMKTGRLERKARRTGADPRERPEARTEHEEKLAET